AFTLQRRDAHDDGSFGVQQILREESGGQSLYVLTDVSALVTSNVGLTRHHARSDEFVVATFGLGYRRPLGGGVRLEVDASFSSFRYNNFAQLGFNDLEASLGLAWRAPILGGVDLYAGYAYSNLMTRSSDSFFQNHALQINAQKTKKLGKAHSLFAGISA